MKKDKIRELISQMNGRSTWQRVPGRRRQCNLGAGVNIKRSPLCERNFEKIRWWHLKWQEH